MKSTTHTQSPAATAAGRNDADSIHGLYEMARGRTVSVWIQTSGMPAEIRALVREMNCLCVTLPTDWQGDLARLGSGYFGIDNKVEPITRRNDTCI